MTHQAIKTMLSKYQLNNADETRHALKEIIQEIALLGLWRSKFFEHAAFYGGTALRILYQLDRFSEDLDFSLLKSNKNFSLPTYHDAIKTELKSFGFDTEVVEKKKTSDSPVQSAFIKANTLEHLLMIDIPSEIRKRVISSELMKIRIEIDTDPPIHGKTESKLLLLPAPFYVRTFTLEELFAGKMHAVLCRAWKGRVKGRDWYDMLWFISRGVKVDFEHLQYRMQQSNHFPEGEKLTVSHFKKIYRQKVLDLDIEKAKADVGHFIEDPQKIAIWNSDFFLQLVDQF